MTVLARRFLRLLVLGLAAAVLLFSLLHTPPGERAASRLVVALLERLSGGSAAFQTFDYRLWRGEVRIGGLSWTRAGVAVRAREVLIRYVPNQPLAVRVAEPDVRVVFPGAPGGEVAALPEALLGVGLTLANGSLRLEWTDENRSLELGSIEAELRPEGKGSRATLAAVSGRLRGPELDFDFGPSRASLRLAPTEIQIDQARVSRGDSFVAASGRLGPLSPLAGELRFQHSIEGALLQAFEPRIALEDLLEGEGVLRRTAGSEDRGEGSFRARAFSMGSLGPLAVEGSWRFEGEAASADVSFEAGDPFPPLSSGLSGRLALAVENWDFENVRGEGLASLRAPARAGPPGIPLRGEVELRLEGKEVGFVAPRLRAYGAEISARGTIGEVLSARLHARTDDVSDLTPLLSFAGAPPSPIPFGGPLDLQATVGGTVASPSIDARVSSDALALGSASFTLEGALAYHATRLQIQDLTLSSATEGSIVADGEISLGAAGGPSGLSARIEDLALARFLAALSSGRLDASLAVSGQISRPELEASFTARELTTPSGLRAEARGRLRSQGLEGRAEVHLENASYRGKTLPGAMIALDSDGGAARITTWLDDGREVLVGDVALRSPYPLEAEVPLQNLPFAEIRGLFPALVEAGMELEVSGRARLEVSLSEPRSFRYRVEPESVLAVYRGIALGATSPFVIEGTGEGFAVTDLTLVGEDTAVGIDGVVPLSRDGSIVLHARGASRLELLRPWFPESELSGRANVDVRVEGALPDPWLRGELSLEEASGRFGELLFEKVEARARWSDTALVLEAVSGETLGGSFRASGELPPQLLDATAPVRLRFEATDLEPLRLVSSEADLRIAVDGELHGPGTDFSRWQGAGTLGSVRFGMRGLEIANQAPGSWSLSEGVFSVSDFRMARGETRLVLSGEAAPFEDAVSWTALASGRIDHEVSRPFLEDLGLAFTGATDLSARAEKKGAEPLVLEGRGTFANARLVVRDPPIAFTNVAGEIALEGSSLSLTRLSADAGGGKIEAAGTIALDNGSLGDVDLRATARTVHLDYPEGLRSEVSGELRLSGRPERLRLTGDVDLTRALLSRDISVESELLQSLSKVSSASAPSPFASRIDLDLRVRAAEAFRIDNNLARMEASVTLTVSGTAASPELSGIASVRPGGRFRFGGNEYQVETGRILLRGYPSVAPELDITARTAVGVYDIRLVLEGTTDNLSTELTSQSHPQLSRGDIASLLITGRTLGEISESSRDIVSNRVVSYVGTTLADLAKLGIGEALPFEIITVEPSLIAGEADPGARFTIGARVDRLALVYSIGLDDAETQIWVVDYELPRRTRAQIVRDEDNEYSLGLAQEIRFDVRDRSRDQAPREVISDVTLTFEDEAPGAEEQEVRDRLDVKAGVRFDYWKIWEKAERARRELRSRGYLEAIVDMAATPREGGGIGVEYRIHVGPRVRFVFPEDEPDDSLEDALRNAWTGNASDSFLTTDLANLATGKLFEDGYFTATAEITTERSEEELVVSLFLLRGPRGKKVVVDVTGNEAVPDSFLLATLPKSGSAAFHDLLTAKRARLKQIVALQYASMGFVAASIEDPRSSFDDRTGEYRVIIPVVEGPRFLVGTIELEGVTPDDEVEVRKRLSLREREPFRVQAFAQDRSAVAAFYRERGFAEVQVDSSVEERPEAAELGVRFAVRPGPRVMVAEVDVQGNDTTRESVIRREVELTPGKPLTTSALRETERGLYELGVFQSAEVVVEEPVEAAPEGAEQESRAVRVAVVETQDLELDYGARASTDGFFEALTELRAPNLFGRAQHAGFRALVGTERQIFRFTYHSPYLSRYRLDTDFFVERSIEHETIELSDFTDRIWTFTAQQARPVTHSISAQWSYTFRRLVRELGEPFPFTNNRSIVTGSLIGDHRDNLLRPRRGSLWLLTTQLAPEALGSDERYTKIFGQLYTYVPLQGDVVWASGYRVGTVTGFGETLDIEDGFRAGGPNSVRGFEQDSLGPAILIEVPDEEPVIIPYGGGGLVVLNQEIRFPIWWRIRGVGFYDAGNAFETASDIRLSELRQSVGAGLRFELPFGLIRLDWATALNPRPNEKSWRLVFSLGDAF
jgi:outer membrane protein assembly complex protein YaeT